MRGMCGLLALFAGMGLLFWVRWAHPDLTDPRLVLAYSGQVLFGAALMLVGVLILTGESGKRR